MKKNRHFIMFVIMLIMMTMMATLATRQFPQTALVEVFFEFGNNFYGTNSFLVQNITDGRLEFTKRYELWQVDADDEDRGVLVHAVDIGQVFYIEGEQQQIFSYDLSESLPEFMQVELEPGMYDFAIIYTFSNSERTHAITIQGKKYR